VHASPRNEKKQWAMKKTTGNEKSMGNGDQQGRRTPPPETSQTLLLLNVLIPVFCDD